MEKIRIGMAGFGPIGRVHLLAYRDIPVVYPGLLPEIELTGVCRSTLELSRKTAEEENFGSAYSDFNEMIDDPSIDVVDIVTPNYLHKDQIIKALRAGKNVLCEKPIALNGKEAREIEKASNNSKRKAGMIFNYRFIPAVIKAHEMIEAGKLGEIYSFRAEYLHTGYQNPDKPFSWRMDFKRSGGGALADLGSHALDLIRHLLGEVASVQCMTKTFIKERPIPGTADMGEVSVDDAAWMRMNLENGGTGILEVSRFATGTLDDLNITVYGSKGSFRFQLMDPAYLYWFDDSRKDLGWCRLETVQHYEEAKTPNPRSVIGWTRFHLENQYRFLKAVAEDTPFFPDLHDGAMVQYILDSAYHSVESGIEEAVQKEK